MAEHERGADAPAEQRRPDDIDALYPGRFLKAADLGGREMTIKIVDVWGEDLEGQKGVKPKAILSFMRPTSAGPGPRELVLPKINKVCIQAMFGSRRADWIGKRITLFATTDRMPMPSGEQKGKACLRILGSPDIAQDIPVTFAPPRRRALHMTMIAVKPPGRSGARPPAAATPPTPPTPQAAHVAPPDVAERDSEPVEWEEGRQ